MCAQRWEVVGGQKGGILVRVGRELDSAEAPSRLDYGALIEEQELKGERLRYRLLDGNGPDEGWVSLKLKGKDLVAKTDRQPRLDVAPAWLKPQGGKKILFLTIPWKGHIIHLKRIAEWFGSKDGYELHAAIFPESEGVMPKSCHCIPMAEDELPAATLMAEIEQGFRRLGNEASGYSAGMSSFNTSVMKVMATFTERDLDPMASLFKFYARTIVEMEPKPDLVVGDSFIALWNMIPALCASEKIRIAVVNSPGIVESWQESGENPVLTDTSKMDDEMMEITAKAVKLPVELVKMNKDPNAVSPDKMQEIMAKVPKPAEMTLVALIFSLGNPMVKPFMTTPIAKKLGVKPKIAGNMIRAVETTPELITFFPSSAALLGIRFWPAPMIFTGPFLPMPAPAADGSVQRDRSEFEATLQPMEPELLDWLYAGEASVPIVYLAFGSIVRPSKDMIKRLTEALDGGPWRVLWALPKELQADLPAGFTDKEQWRIQSFVPQADVLKCNRVKCFVSHNGANSTVESLSCGVPMVCMPFYMDQYDWSKVVCSARKAGIQVDRHGSASELREAVTKVLSEPSYHEGALTASRVMRMQEEAVLKRLGTAMAPPAKTVGYGVSIAAAALLALLNEKDPSFVYEIINKSANEALDMVAAEVSG